MFPRANAAGIRDLIHQVFVLFQHVQQKVWVVSVITVRYKNMGTPFTSLKYIEEGHVRRLVIDIVLVDTERLDQNLSPNFIEICDILPRTAIRIARSKAER